MLVEILIDAPEPHSADAYLRFIPRNEMDIAVVGVGSWLHLDGDKVSAARISLGAVAATPLFAAKASESLVGKKLDDAAIDRAAKLAIELSSPIDDMRGTAEFRRHLVGVLTSARCTSRPSALARRNGASAARSNNRHSNSTDNRQDERQELTMDHKTVVETTINGEQMEFLCEPRQSLLEVLRDVLGMTGSKEGCLTGDCGACTVLVDGRAACSCLMLGVEAAGHKIETVEGLAQGSKLHPLQQKFLENASLQCGICTPGFLMSAKALLDHNPHPTEAEIRYALAGNLCRCTGYDKIVHAVLEVSKGKRVQGGLRSAAVRSRAAAGTETVLGKGR